MCAFDRLLLVRLITKRDMRAQWNEKCMHYLVGKLPENRPRDVGVPES